MAVRALRQAASLEHQPRVAVVHGPNLNTLGRREPQIYGTQTLEDINGRLLEIGADLGFELSFFQSNHEGALIDHLQSLTDRSDGVIINAGAYSHSSVALRDALTALEQPAVEVHLTNIFARETFRQHTILAGAVRGVIAGFGALSYELALLALAQHLRR